MEFIKNNKQSYIDKVYEFSFHYTAFINRQFINFMIYKCEEDKIKTNDSLFLSVNYYAIKSKDYFYKINSCDVTLNFIKYLKY